MFNFLRVSAVAVFFSIAACGTQSVQKPATTSVKQPAPSAVLFENNFRSRDGELLELDRAYGRCLKTCQANGGGTACYSKCAR